jgi:hypothetical protein
MKMSAYMCQALKDQWISGAQMLQHLEDVPSVQTVLGEAVLRPAMVYRTTIRDMVLALSNHAPWHG